VVYITGWGIWGTNFFLLDMRFLLVLFFSTSFNVDKRFVRLVLRKIFSFPAALNLKEFLGDSSLHAVHLQEKLYIYKRQFYLRTWYAYLGFIGMFMFMIMC